MDLDDVVPFPQHVITQSRVVKAPIGIVWDELVRVTLAQLPLSRVLTEVRHLPSRLDGKASDPLGPQTFLDETPIPVLFSKEPTAVLSAGLSQAWRPVGGTAPVLNARDLRAWSQPGWIKVGMDFRLEPGRSETLIGCETRIVATDARTRRIFGAYWLLVRPGSMAIRAEVLRVVARRAESRHNAHSSE